MPDYSRDPVRREPAALLAHAFAAGRLDRAEYERRLDRLRQDPPDLTRLLWRLPRPAYVTRGDNAFLRAPDRVYARALFGVLEEVPDDPAAPRRRLADRIEAAATAGELRAICAGQVRATHQDRRTVLKVLLAAERDGRLDAAEYDRRVRDAEEAKLLDDLHQLHADLPDRADSRTWAGHLRIGTADRERARDWLGEGLADGRLDALVADLVLPVALPALPDPSTVDVIDRVGAVTRWGRVDTLGRRDRPASALVETLLTKRVWRAGMLLLWGVPAATLVALCAVGQGALVLAGAAVPLLMVGVLYTEATVRRETLRREGRILG